MASIALTIIGRIGYLAIGAIVTRAVFPFVAKGAKTWVFDSRKKAQDVHWGEVLRVGPVSMILLPVTCFTRFRYLS